MKNYSPSEASGCLTGVLSTILGSAIFSVIVLAYFTLKAYFTGNEDSGMALSLDSICIVPIILTLYAAWFSVLPGALGGVLLAVWLKRAHRSTKSKTQMGLLVGVLAGLFASILGFGFNPHWNRDWSTIRYVLLVILIAAPISAIATRWLGSGKQVDSVDSID